MELDLQIIWAPCANLYSLAETPAFGLIFESANILVSQDRRHLFVTTWIYPIIGTCRSNLVGWSF